MIDDRVMAKGVNIVGDQPSSKPRYARQRKPFDGSEAFSEELDYPPTQVPPPDPNRPLLEALDRLRVVERPVDQEYANTLRAMKAYQDQTTRTHAAAKAATPPPETPAEDRP